jgi:hypothetical protein
MESSLRESRAHFGSTRGALAALALAFLILLLPSSATADWNTTQVVSGAGTSTSQTRIAGGTDGSAWVVWKRNVGGFDVIQGTKVALDGTQGPIITLSGPTLQATDPVIATRADGSAMVGWLNTAAIDDTVHTVSITADGTVGPITTRSTVGPVGQPAADISIALGHDGTAALAWRKFNGVSWVIQAVKVAADGTSGTIHDLSDPASSASAPDIAATPGAVPPAVSTPPSFRAVWSGGTGVDGNVFSRQINPDDTLTDLFQALFPPESGGVGTGGDPHDVQIAYEPDGAVDIMWVREREGQTTADPPVVYYNDAIEWIRGIAGTVFSAGVPQFINTVTPVLPEEEYNVTTLDLNQPFGNRPVLAWVHALNGGGYRIDTSQIVRNGQLQGWATPAGESLTEFNRPVIAANNSGVGALGWGVPSVVPGQSNSQWARFSTTSFLDPFTPTDTYSQDTGFVIANTGETMAAYTGVDAGLVGSSKVVTFTRPGITVSPGQHVYGKVRIGRKSTRFISIRSSGETTAEVTGITLSGANASQYSLSGANECIGEFGSGNNCQFEVNFTPGSTGQKTALVTITSDAGVSQTNLAGTGQDKTQNSLTVKPRNASARKGKVIQLRVRAANTGGTASKSTNVCVRLNQRALRLGGNRCRTIGSLPAGASRNITFRVRVTWRARTGVRYPVSIRMNSGNAIVRKVVANLRRKR